jgi:hypothetical protein
MESDCGGLGSVFKQWNRAGFTIGERLVTIAVAFQYDTTWAGFQWY